jgi:hypothetical protein
MHTGGGTFSLPVTLPEGQVQLDFSKPGGEAELSVWVVSERLVEGAYGTAGIVGAAAVALVLWLAARLLVRRIRSRRAAPASPVG